MCYNLKKGVICMMTIFEELELVKNIALSVDKMGGSTYYVGGYVRDELMGIECKDIDIEVHWISPDTLEDILDKFGERIEIGKSFGIYNLKGCSIDIAMPRSERALGNGHRDFHVDIDPFIGTKKACARRDFTINALMKNVITGEIVDYFGGVNDLNSGVIRHVNDKTFAEDALRVLRAAQFASRFGFSIADETVSLCKKMSLKDLSSERVFDELTKALLKSSTPSLFFKNLLNMDKLSEWFPEVQQLIGIEQSKIHHAEGDVWNHTMMVIDEAAKRRELAKKPLGFMLAALTHDFGKTICTKVINGQVHAYMHETEGLPIIQQFINRLTSENALTKYVLNMAQLHMQPNAMAADKSSIKATNKMFDRSIEPWDLVHLAQCDRLGKISCIEHVSSEPFLTERLKIFEEYMSRPYVMGRDLKDVGIEPNENYKDLLLYAHKLRLAGVPKDDALKQTLSYARTYKNTKMK